MSITITIILCIVFLVVFYVSLSVANNWMNRILNLYQSVKKEEQIHDMFEQVMAIFNISKDMAYKKVYQEELLVHISSGYKLNNDEIYSLSEKYIKMVFDCCGKNNVDRLLGIYGDLDSICLFLSNDFVLKVIDDEVKLSGIMSNSDEPNKSTIEYALKKQTER